MPLLNRILQKIGRKAKANPQYGCFGDYITYEQAAQYTTGYQANNILEKTKNALLKVKNGEAPYERDSVTFNKKEYPFAIISSLLYIAFRNNNTLNVIDFGGSLGTTWYQVQDFIPKEVSVSWTVVEQTGHVNCGKEFFEDETLKFTYTIEDAIKIAKPSVLFLSGVVGYLPNPHEFLAKIAALDIPFLLFDRTSFVNRSSDRFIIHKVDPKIYEASYPACFFSEAPFLNHFAKYNKKAEFDSYVKGENLILIDNEPAGYNKGFLFERISSD